MPQMLKHDSVCNIMQVSTYRNGRNRNRGYNSLQNFYVRFKIGRGFNMEEVIIYERNFQIFLYSTIMAQIICSMEVLTVAHFLCTTLCIQHF